MPASCLRVCLAICKRQRATRDWFPHVIVSLDELSALAGWKAYPNKSGQLEQNHGNLRRAIRRLVAAGLLAVEPGAGKVPNSNKRKADIYRLGAALQGVSETTPLRVSETTPLPNAPRDRSGVETDTPRPYLPQGGEGDRGETTAALTGGSPTTELSSESISPSRLRDLLEKFRPTSKELN